MGYKIDLVNVEDRKVLVRLRKSPIEYKDVDVVLDDDGNIDVVWNPGQVSLINKGNIHIIQRKDDTYLRATKLARRHMSGQMRIAFRLISDRLNDSDILSTDKSYWLFGKYIAPISVNRDFLAGMLRMYKLWCEIYEEADKIWKKESGV